MYGMYDEALNTSYVIPETNFLLQIIEVSDIQLHYVWWQARLQLYISRDNLGRNVDDVICATGRGNSNCSSPSHGWRWQSDVVILWL